MGAGSERFLGGLKGELSELVSIGEVIQNWFRRGKLWIFNNTVGTEWWADLFGVIAKADSAKDVAVSPSAITEVIKTYLMRTLEISAVAGEEIGSEGIMEMMSEGLSSALETNFNASLQTILNVWKGSLPPDLSFALQLGSEIDRNELYYMLSVIAPIGHSNYAILSALRSGILQRIDTKYSSLQEFYAQMLTNKFQMLNIIINELQILLSDVCINTIRDVTQFRERIENMIKNISEETLARVNQLEDNLEANKNRYDNQMIADDEYNLRLLEIDADISASEAVYDEYIDEVLDMYDEYVNTLTTFKNGIANLIKAYLDYLEQILTSQIDDFVSEVNSLNDITEMKNKLLSIYNKLKTYRQSGFNYS